MQLKRLLCQNKRLYAKANDYAGLGAKCCTVTDNKQTIAEICQSPTCHLPCCNESTASSDLRLHNGNYRKTALFLDWNCIRIVVYWHICITIDTM